MRKEEGRMLRRKVFCVNCISRTSSSGHIKSSWRIKQLVSVNNITRGTKSNSDEEKLRLLLFESLQTKLL